jgi:hypothetical protein
VCDDAAVRSGVGGPAPSSSWREEAGFALEICALTGLAVTQPVLDVFGRAPQVFIEARARASDVVLFAIAVALLPALVVWSALALTRLGGRTVRRLAQSAVVGFGAGIFAMRAVKVSTEQSRAVLLATFIAAAVGAVVLERTVASARTFLRWAAPAPLVFVVVFLFASPVQPLVVEGDVPEPVDLGVDRSVVVLMFDELPTASLVDEHGRIDPDRFPGFARLAASSTWYRNHTTVSESTFTAVPAALSGMVPSETDGTPAWTDHPDNLFTLLGGSFEMHVVEPVTCLCPEALCPRPAGACDRSCASPLGTLLRRARGEWPDIVGPDRHRDLDELAEDFVATVDARIRGDEASARRGTLRPEHYDEWLASIGPSERPTFHYFHALLPHLPWRVHADGTLYDASAGTPGLASGYTWLADWPAEAARQRHLLQLRHTDSLLVELLDRLDATGMAADTILVVTADHGVSFIRGQTLRGIDDANAHQIMPTPLFVRLPGGSGGVVDDRNAIIVDVVPTIADALGVELPWRPDGQSLLGPPRTGAAKPMRRASSALQPRQDAFLTFDAGEVLADMLAAAPSFGPARPTPEEFEAAVLASGPAGELIGRPVDDLRVGDAADGTATIKEIDALRTVQTGQPLPSLLRGSVSGVSSGGTVVAVLNGRVAGTGSVYRRATGGRVFVMLLRGDLFVEGHNDLALYSRAGGELHPLAIED